MSKRLDYLPWDSYYMLLAEASSRRSKDPKTQVGACIVDKNGNIQSVGYNGFPRGCDDDIFPWTIDDDPNDSKHNYVVHAELNAILNVHGMGQDLHGSTLYCTLFPCNECVKAIIQSGIKKVVYKSIDVGKAYIKPAHKMLEAAGVEIEKYNMHNISYVAQL